MFEMQAKRIGLRTIGQNPGYTMRDRTLNAECPSKWPNERLFQYSGQYLSSFVSYIGLGGLRSRLLASLEADIWN